MIQPHAGVPAPRFDGDIAAVPLSPGYRFGLALVALVMLVLPLLYVGLILLAGWGLKYHATEHLVILTGEGMRKVRVLVYVGPLVAGAILILFMIKPLFARRPPALQPTSLEREAEPKLFAFIEQLCAVVGAPLPRRIDVDHQVNASAGFRRGARSLLGDDLVLTIGLPLVAGMSLRQLTGVLAHEFGHFAQGGGMRLTYIIRTVNGWFARVVYERDAWDVQLDHWSKNLDARLGVVLYLARALVGLTRKILWALMMAGHSVSCFMMRQMEFDADRYEARVSGSAAFESTVRRLHELSIANAHAGRFLAECYKQGQLADDLPRLIRIGVDRLPPEAVVRITEHISSSRTGALDTHPCDRDRIESARLENASGVFHDDAPATSLFADFEGLCKRATLALYRQQLDIVPLQAIVPVAALLAAPPPAEPPQAQAPAS